MDLKTRRLVNRVLLPVLSLLVAETAFGEIQDGFTGETLTLIYATDVRESVAFYEALGFEHQYYYDYQNDEYTLEWDRDYPPEYAEVTAGKIRISMATPDDENGILGGGVRHYFMVDDVELHFRRVTEQGIRPEPNEIEGRPWLRFFTISDPDHHQIVIAEKDEGYFAKTAERIRRLHAEKE